MRLRFLTFFILLVTPVFAGGPARFFFEGDGLLHLARLSYRLPSAEGSKEQSKINRAFGVPAGSNDSVSLRLIALLDHLEDHFKAKGITINSGFRSHNRNEQLREQGLLAASVSLHLDGMAADVEFRGVSPRKVAEYARSLNCCGVGYYHGRSVHLDIGPVRSWDEETSGVEKGPPPTNKKVIVRTDKDLYKPGEKIRFQLARLQAYPFGIDARLIILKDGKKIGEFQVEGAKTDCIPIPDRTGRLFFGTVPLESAPEGDVKIQVRFCENRFPEMPGQIESNTIQIVTQLSR